MRTSTSNCIVDKIAHWMEAEVGGERQREREREVEGKREKRETGVRDSREGEERESDIGCMTYIRC